MAIIVNRLLDAAPAREYWVIAIMPERTLPRLREALAGTDLRSVLVSKAISWSGDGLEYIYRGQAYRSDKDVVRVEIACTTEQVDRIVEVVDHVVVAGGTPASGPRSLVAFPITHTAEVPEQ